MDERNTLAVAIAVAANRLAGAFLVFVAFLLIPLWGVIPKPTRWYFDVPTLCITLFFIGSFIMCVWVAGYFLWSKLPTLPPLIDKNYVEE